MRKLEQSYKLLRENLKKYLTLNFLLQPTHYLTISSHGSDDTIDSAGTEKVQLKKLVGQMKTNLCNISILSEPDLELLSNMDPNSVADITGRDFVEQLKETSGR